jgi:hypothetical protein
MEPTTWLWVSHGSAQQQFYLFIYFKRRYFRIFFFSFYKTLHTIIALMIDKWSLAVSIFSGEMLEVPNFLPRDGY